MEFKHNYIAGLVLRAKDNDSDAFAELYSMTYSKVYNYARHYLKDDGNAEDAVQEVFILALKNLVKLEDPMLFVAWLNQISFHVCFDMAKKLHSDYGDIDSELVEELSDDNPSSNPEDSSIQSDEAQRLKAAIDRLGVTEKHLITLRYINNMKIDQVVEVTEMSKSTVKRHLISAVEHLRDILKD